MNNTSQPSNLHINPFSNVSPCQSLTHLSSANLSHKFITSELGHFDGNVSSSLHVGLFLVVFVTPVHTEDKHRQHHQSKHHPEYNGQLVVVVSRGTGGRRHRNRGRRRGSGSGRGCLCGGSGSTWLLGCRGFRCMGSRRECWCLGGSTRLN